MKSKLNIMVDVETLGESSSIIALNAKSFDLSDNIKNYSFSEYINVEKLSYISVNGKILTEWFNNKSALFNKILNGTNKKDKFDLISDFHKWLKNLCDKFDVYLWGNGELYNNKFIRECFCNSGKECPYFHDEDMRTVLYLAVLSSKLDYNDFCKKYSLEKTSEDDLMYDVNNNICLLKSAYKLLSK